MQDILWRTVGVRSVGVRSVGVRSVGVAHVPVTCSGYLVVPRIATARIVSADTLVHTPAHIQYIPPGGLDPKG
jgi:hypothetical protein